MCHTDLGSADNTDGDALGGVDPLSEDGECHRVQWDPLHRLQLRQFQHLLSQKR
jgi:hypothetical protein